MNVRTKLFGAMGSLSLMIALLGIYAYSSLSQLEWQNGIYNAIAKADNLMFRARLSQADYLLLKDSDFKQQVDDYLTQSSQQLDTARSMMAVQSSINRVNAIKQSIEEYRRSFGNVASIDGDISMADMQPLFSAAQRAAEASSTLLTEEREISAKVRQNVTLTIVAGVGIALIVSIVLAILLFRSIMKPLNKTMELAEALSQGDLSKTVTTNKNDEFSRMIMALNQSTTKLREVITQIKTSVDQLGQAGDVVERSVESANNSMDEQKDEANALASTIQSLASSNEVIASRCEDASLSSAEAKQQALSGDQTITSASDGMQALSGELKNATDSVHKLNDDSKNVADILSVIRSIAEQTNLLALNAAIEAARAGEQGRGFAVVADEVRTLAARTTNSIEEITSIIDIIQGGASEVVNVIDASNDTGQKVIHLNEDASSAYSNITDAINKIAEDNAQVAREAKDQLALTQNTKSSVEHISELSVANAEALSEIAGQVQKQSREQQSLIALVNFFKV